MAKNTIGNIALGLVSNINPFTRSMKKGRKSIRVFGNSVSSVKRRVVAFGGALTAVVAGGSMGLLIKRQFELIDSLGKTSDKLGIATEQLTGLRLAASQTASMGSGAFDTALQRMIRRVSEAAAGTGAAKDALRELGLDAQALAEMSPDTQFRRIADAMKGVGRQSDRVRLAMRLFDTEGVALVNTLQGGSEVLDEFQGKAERLGLTVSRFDAKQIEAANDAMEDMRMAMQGIVIRLAPKLAPLVEALANKVVDVVTSVEDVDSGIKSVIDSITMVLRGANQVWAAIKNWIAALKVTGNVMAIAIITPINAGIKAVKGLVGIFKDFGSVLEKFKTLWRAALEDPIGSMKVLFFKTFEAVVRKISNALNSFQGLADSLGFGDAFAEGAAKIESQADALFRINRKLEETSDFAKKFKDLQTAIADAFAAGNQGGTSLDNTLKNLRESLAANKIELIETRDAWMNAGSQFDNWVAGVMASAQRLKSAMSFGPQGGEESETVMPTGEDFNQGLKSLGLPSLDVLQSHIGSMKEHLSGFFRFVLNMRKKDLASERFTLDQKLAASAGFFGNLASIAQQSGKGHFGIIKALSIAEGVIQGIRAAIGAYSVGASIGGPVLGGAFAAAAFTAQSRLLQTMKGTQYGSSSMPSGGFASSASSTEVSGGATDDQGGMLQQVNINFSSTGGTDRFTRFLAEELNRSAKRGTIQQVGR